jgi:hypothetical protein
MKGGWLKMWKLVGLRKNGGRGKVMVRMVRRKVECFYKRCYVDILFQH